MASKKRPQNDANKVIDNVVLACSRILLLTLLQVQGAIACDVTTLDLWIGEDTEKAENKNTDTVYECPDGSFGWYVEWDAGDATTPDFEGTICIGSTELDDFTADGDATTASGSADLSGISTGEHTVEAWIRRDGGEWCESDNGRTLKVVEVASLEPDEGTEIDDGDSDPDTKLFVVCIVAPSPASTLTVTATPNPSVAEADLPDCWTLTGGTGTGKLTRTVDKTTAGETVIACSCGADSEKITTIWVVKGQVNLLSTPACDGEVAEVDLIFTPAGVEDHITDVEWDCTEPTGVTNYGSPSGEDLSFSQRGDITEWQIDNARWYSTDSAAHCNENADWEITATYEIGGSLSCSTDYDTTAAPVVFTASATEACLQAETTLDRAFSGDPTYTTTYNATTDLWETTVTQGTFIRDLQASVDMMDVPPNSQFYEMIQDEEEYHETQQMENPTHAIYGSLWDAETIIEDVKDNEPYTDADEAVSLEKAMDAFVAIQDAWNIIWGYYVTMVLDVRCDLETEAKAAAGSSHRLDMPCACGDCSE